MARPQAPTTVRGKKGSQPPSVPGNVSGVSVLPAQINLSWNASSDGTYVVGYRIYRWTDAAPTPVRIASVASSPYQNTGLTPGTTYYYSVSAYNNAGAESGQSSTASAVVLDYDTTPPGVPTGLAASNVTSSSMTLSWNAATDPAVSGDYTSGGVTYRLRQTSPSAVTYNTSNTSYPLSGLSAGTQYTFTIAALDAAGNESAQSASISQQTSSGTVTPLFLDSFDYVVNRNDSNLPTVWTSRGWNSVKAMNVTSTQGGYGWIYTQNDATLGKRVAVLESHPELSPDDPFSNEKQTDYYLTYGNAAANNKELIPGNVWITFWTYVANGTRFGTADKFMYPTWHTSHNVDTLHWMILHGRRCVTPRLASEAPNGQRRFSVIADGANNAAADVGAGERVTDMYMNLNLTPLAADTWHQIKMHFDTSGAQGTWEMWRRAHGVSNWTECARWIGGVTDVPHWNTGAPTRFYWSTSSSYASSISTYASPSGHTAMKMPTVVNCYDNDLFSNTMLMSDFALYSSDPG